MRWSDLEPEAGIVNALQHAGVRPEDAGQNEKRHWSESFADGCAIAIADEFRRSAVRTRRILPKNLSSGTEPLTPLGSGTKKRIDVTVANPVLGLEIGVSLKGFNFRDRNSRNFDKNLTGRLYELADEVRLVHEHLPHAFMVAVLFLPLDAAKDKGGRAMSSFAHTVVKLRERTGRLDASLPGHAPRCDAAFVGLYTIGDEEEAYPAGLVRLLDVTRPPPRRGRPRVEDTLSLREVVGDIVVKATFQSAVVWSDPEEDD